MSQNSDTPQGDLWLTDGRSAPTIDHRNVLVRGKYWLDMLQDHEDITHAWIGLVNDDHSVRWVAELIPASMPTHFFEGRCMDVIQQRHEFVFVDHQELISGGLFPLIRGGKVFGILALVSGNTDYFKSGTRKWLHTLTRLMSDGLSWDRGCRIFCFAKSACQSGCPGRVASGIEYSRKVSWGGRHHCASLHSPTQPV